MTLKFKDELSFWEGVKVISINFTQKKFLKLYLLLFKFENLKFQFDFQIEFFFFGELNLKIFIDQIWLHSSCIF